MTKHIGWIKNSSNISNLLKYKSLLFSVLTNNLLQDEYDEITSEENKIDEGEIMEYDENEFSTERGIETTDQMLKQRHRNKVLKKIRYV